MENKKMKLIDNDQIDVEYYKQLALQNKKHYAKFLAALKKKPPKNLDKVVKSIHEEVFSEIDCTKCGNCCKSLGPNWTEADITRVAKKERMKLADFEAAYLKTDEDGDKVFQCMPCPFLGSDNLCDIYADRPKACREFPHTDRKKIYQINNLTIQNIEYCPAAYMFVEKLSERLNYK